MLRPCWEQQQSQMRRLGPNWHLRIAIGGTAAPWALQTKHLLQSLDMVLALGCAGGLLSAQTLQRISSSSQCCSSSQRPAALVRQRPGRPSAGTGLPFSSQGPAPLAAGSTQQLSCKLWRRGQLGGSSGGEASGGSSGSGRGALQVVAGGGGGGFGGHGSGRGEPVDTPAKAALVGIAVSYVALIVLIPFVAVFFQASYRKP